MTPPSDSPADPPAHQPADPPSDESADQERAGQLAAGLAAVRRRIATACASAGRDPAQVTLVVVTKTYPVSDLALLAGLGVRDLGENREQEAAAKRAALVAMRSRGSTGSRDSTASTEEAEEGDQLVWHFIGRLQTNKARRVAGYADLVHSVDRAPLVEPLARGAEAVGRRVGCLVQVTLDGDPSRGGTEAQDVPALAEAIAAQPWLELRGVMAVAPVGVDPATAFAVLPGLRDQLRGVHPRADIISAGMSGDLEAAITVGATHLRVGSAVLGARSPLG